MKDIPANVDKLIKEAKLSGCWIYHKPTKKWFTPEEFAKGWQTLYSEHVTRRTTNTNVSDFAISNPIAGLRLRTSTLKKVADEAASFLERIEEYYELKIKKAP